MMPSKWYLELAENWAELAAKTPDTGLRETCLKLAKVYTEIHREVKEMEMKEPRNEREAHGVLAQLCFLCKEPITKWQSSGLCARCKAVRPPPPKSTWNDELAWLAAVCGISSAIILLISVFRSF